MNEELPQLGMEASLFDPTDVAALEAVQPNTKVILVEVVSTRRCALRTWMELSLSPKRGIKVIVDNTFTTPRAISRSRQVLTLHSVTRLLSGHSDALLGYVAAADADLAERPSHCDNMGFYRLPVELLDS